MPRVCPGLPFTRMLADFNAMGSDFSDSQMSDHAGRFATFMSPVALAIRMQVRAREFLCTSTKRDCLRSTRVGEDLESHVAADLERLRIPNPDHAAWLRTSLEVAFADTDRPETEQRRLLNKQLSEITNKLDRLLSAYLEGMIDPGTYQSKQTDLKQSQADVQE